MGLLPLPTPSENRKLFHAMVANEKEREVKLAALQTRATSFSVSETLTESTRPHETGDQFSIGRVSNDTFEGLHAPKRHPVFDIGVKKIREGIANAFKKM